MSLNELVIRISPDGKIVYDLSGMDQEQIRLHREMIEEAVGKITAEGDPREPPPNPGVLAEDEEKAKLRNRR